MNNYKFELVVDFTNIEKFRIGTSITKNDIIKYSYISPNGATEIVREMKKVILHDIYRVKNWINNKTNFIVESVKPYYENGKKLFIVNCIAVSAVPLVGGILAYTKTEKSNFTETQINKKLLPPVYMDTIHADGSVSSFANVKRQIPLEINKKVIKCSFETPISKAKIEKKLAVNKEKRIIKAKGVERKSKILTMNNDDIRTILLNQAESFYPIPYFDGYICGKKNYSIGYGSGMSFEEATKYWKRAGLSNEEGLKLANYLGKCGWKKGLQVIKEWKNKPGVLTREEANELRDLEWNKMFEQINEKYTFLPDFQKRILTNTAYNCGIAKITGYKNGNIRIPESELSKALKKYDYWDDRVFDAYMKIKTYNKGLKNRRKVEAIAFCKTIKNEGIVDNRTEKTLELALNEKP